MKEIPREALIRQYLFHERKDWMLWKPLVLAVRLALSGADAVRVRKN